MVTKSKKKHTVFSKKYTRKNKYGGELGAVTGTERPDFMTVYKENFKKLKKDGIKPDVAKIMKEARISSGYNDWVKQNPPQIISEATEVSSTSEAPEVSSTSVSSESTSVASEIQIPSLVNEDLFNKALASNILWH